MHGVRQDGIPANVHAVHCTHEPTKTPIPVPSSPRKIERGKGACRPGGCVETSQPSAMHGVRQDDIPTFIHAVHCTHAHSVFVGSPPTPPINPMTDRLQNARSRLGQLVLAHPELDLSAAAPVQSATNAVLYGTRAGEPVVFKLFERAHRKLQDERMLRWLAPSGVVPRLYPYDFDDVLVMEYLPGQMMYEVQAQLTAAATPTALAPLYRQVGAALAKLVAHAFTPGDNVDEWRNPHTSDPFWNTTFETFFDEVITSSQRALKAHNLAQPPLQQSLANFRAARSEILDQRTFLHVDDVHGANIMVDQGKFAGIFDFEMSRLGNELYLLGATLQWACLGDQRQWRPMLAGYESERGTPLSRETRALVKLFAPFQNWIRFSWYWGSDEQPNWVWQRNVRQNILKQLIQTLDAVDEVTTES